MKTERSVITRGVVGGILAATAVVLFFLVLDAIEGRPLETPAFMASVLLGQEQGAQAGGIIALYTVLHYLVFIVLGVVVAWFLARARTPAPLLLGVVVGFLLFDVVFYASLMASGVDVVRELGWPVFLAGNLLAGVVLVGYLGRTGPRPTRSWGDVLGEHRVLREGMMAGLVGALAVAAWFFLVDLVLGRLLFTPGALGSAVFFGIDDPAQVQVTAATVLGYTFLHFAAFLVTGLVFAAVVGQAEQSPPVLLGLVLLFVTFETLAIGVLTIVAAWLLDVIPWWSIAVANLVAAAAMGIYLWKKHPHLAGKLDRAERPDTAAPRERQADGAAARP